MSTVYIRAAHPREHARERRQGHAPGHQPSGATAPLRAAGLCVLALALTWVIAALVPVTHFKDAAALYRFTLLGGPRLDELANSLLRLLDPGLYTLWAVALVAIALMRRRPNLALAVALVLALAPAIAELLKPLLAHSHDSVGHAVIGAASWPSGHETAATALAMCAVLVAPERLRPVVAALGVVFVAAVGVSLLVLAWHLPSDVLGGCLLATLCTALALAGLRIAEPPWRERRLAT